MSFIINSYRFASATPYLLDTYTGAAAAISTSRILKTGVTNCLTVRRSTGGETSYTPAQILAGDHITYVGAGNDGFIASAIDQSGNGRNLVQATTANQPKIVSAGTGITSNGKPAFKIQGTTINLAASTFAAAGVNRTFILVFETLNTSISNYSNYFAHATGFSDNNINGIFGKFGSSNSIVGYVGSGAANSSTTGSALSLSTRYIVEVYITGGTHIKLYVNNTLVESKTITISPETTSRTLTIGQGGNASREFNVLEAIYWDNADKFSDRAGIYTDLSTYYA